MRRMLLLAVVMLAGCGGDDGPSDPGGNNPPPPPPDPTLSSVTCTLDAISDIEYEGATRPSVAFAWSGHGVMSDASTTVLDSAVVSMGAVRVQKFTGGTSGSGTLGSGDTADGDNTLSATCYRETRTGADTEGFGIFKLVTLNFTAIHFFSQEANLTGTTVTVSGETIALTDGQGSLTVRVGTNNIQIQDTDSGQLHYLEEVGGVPGEHLVFDRQNLPQAVAVDADTDYQIVSVESEQFLKDMAQQWNTTGTAMAPMPGVLKIVLYKGNPTCTFNWHPEYPDKDDCSDNGVWLPGRLLEQYELDNFDTFIDDTGEILNNSLLPWRPYAVEAIIADTSSIMSFIDVLDAQYATHIPKDDNTHVIVGTSAGPLREDGFVSVNSQGILYISSSSATVIGNEPWIFANELQLFGSLHESLNYPVCSIRDDESNKHPDCPFGINIGTPTWFQMDQKMILVTATYLARAQTQPSPFNVALPAP